MADFEKCFPIILSYEGGYSNNPNDPGKATNYGITEKTARANGYTGDMKDLPLSLAKAIYKKDYWDPFQLDKELSLKFSLAIFDAAVNCGATKVKGWLKQIPSPIVNKSAYLMALRGKHYAEICIKDPTLLVFIAGWYNRLADCAKQWRSLS